jgi:sporulation protein YlmC with PRC-barrel domain
MRNITYTLIGLFLLSLLFAGSSFADSGKMTICTDSSEAMMLLGTSLYTPTGVYIGDVTDLAINPSTGRIDSVLVNRIRGEGARVVAIPFTDISETAENTFVYNPPEDRGWPFVVSYYDQLPYDAYGFNHLAPMPQGDQKFTALVESRECGS